MFRHCRRWIVAPASGLRSTAQSLVELRARTAQIAAPLLRVAYAHLQAFEFERTQLPR
jgi:hypothetical protein